MVDINITITWQLLIWTALIILALKVIPLKKLKWVLNWIFEITKGHK